MCATQAWPDCWEHCLAYLSSTGADNFQNMGYSCDDEGLPNIDYFIDMTSIIYRAYEKKLDLVMAAEL